MIPHSPITKCCWLSYKIHFSLHFAVRPTNASFLLYKRHAGKNKTTAIFFFLHSTCILLLSIFFYFLFCNFGPKCQTAPEWSAFSYSASFSGSVIWIHTNQDGEMVVDNCKRTSHLSSFWKQCCTVHSFTIPWINMWSVLKAVSNAFMSYFKFLQQNHLNFLFQSLF